MSTTPFQIPAGVLALSFDIWETVYYGNKNFTRPRLRLIFDELGYPRHDIELIRDAYLVSNKHFNRQSEIDEVDYGMRPRLAMMFEILGITDELPDDATIRHIQCKVGQLRTRPEYMPSFIEPDLLTTTLPAARARGLLLGTLSNTGMDDHLVMQPVMETNGLWQAMDVRKFSSLDGRAKPSEGFFRLMPEAFGVEPHQVLHIGDNVNADLPATRAGMHSVLYAPKGSDRPHIKSIRELVVG